jgi:hypothetical protein
MGPASLHRYRIWFVHQWVSTRVDKLVKALEHPFDLREQHRSPCHRGMRHLADLEVGISQIIPRLDRTCSHNRDNF